MIKREKQIYVCDKCGAEQEDDYHYPMNKEKSKIKKWGTTTLNDKTYNLCPACLKILTIIELRWLGK